MSAVKEQLQNLPFNEFGIGTLECQACQRKFSVQRQNKKLISRGMCGSGGLLPVSGCVVDACKTLTLPEPPQPELQVIRPEIPVKCSHVARILKAVIRK